MTGCSCTSRSSKSSSRALRSSTSWGISARSPGRARLADSRASAVGWRTSSGAVSYTHLDVYKRQVYTITTQPGYVLHPEHGQRLVEVYFDRFEQRMDEAGRKGMNYFFQDELAYPITTRSWSDDFREEFLNRKGYDIVPYLPALVEEIGPEMPKVRLCLLYTSRCV